LFETLAKRQRELVARIAAQPAPEFPWLKQAWDEGKQWAFTERVLADMGYDFKAGRQDKSVHPFSISFDVFDARVTTRVDVNDLFSALTGSMHEGGHALYEQGFREEDRRTLLAEGISLGIHESQSRMWENMIGRSRAFWDRYAPLLCETYGEQLRGVTPADIYRAINVVQPSLIRVEADECTYNLHVVLRFEIERALIEGDLDVDGIPSAWNAKVKDYLGLDVPDDAHGCLQDVHWSHGAMGYFPTYALGNVYAGQLLEAIERDVPSLWSDVGEGRFSPLLDWLREHVHRIGRRKSAVQCIADATGSAPGPEPYLGYLTRKYEALYGP